MKTLICVRQLPYSKPTIQFGSLIAGLEDSQVTLMTVVENNREHAGAAADLEEVQALLPASNVTSKVRYGSAIDEILQEASEQAYDVIVVGSHDVNGLLDALLGSVTGKVANRARSSVLVVKEDRPDLRKILIAIGGQKMNRAVVKTGARLAQAADAAATVLYVTDPVPTMYTGLDEMDETLEELLHTDTPIARHLRWSAQYLDSRGITANLELVQGVATDEILREARQGEYDLLVIGAPVPVGPFRKLLVERVTPQVVERAPCSVFVVR